jgi:adenylate kinase family enzyme
MNNNRIIIIGDAGRGKSTLASKLSVKLDIPHHSTDDYFYEIKFSKIRDRQEALKQITEVFKKDKWIIEGTTIWLLEPGIGSAYIIIYLQYKNIWSQWLSIIKRHFARKDNLKGTLALMRHVFYKRYGLGYKKGKMTHKEFIEPYKDKVITLSSFKDIDNFIKSL